MIQRTSISTDPGPIDARHLPDCAWPITLVPGKYNALSKYEPLRVGMPWFIWLTLIMLSRHQWLSHLGWGRSRSYVCYLWCKNRASIHLNARIFRVSDPSDKLTPWISCMGTPLRLTLYRTNAYSTALQLSAKYNINHGISKERYVHQDSIGTTFDFSSLVRSR